MELLVKVLRFLCVCVCVFFSSNSKACIFFFVIVTSMHTNVMFFSLVEW
jgi:hypothetical protein